MVDKQIDELSIQIITALKEIRVNIVKEEFILQEHVARVLDDNNIPYEKEFKLAPRKRIDFFIEPGIGLEVKKGKPNKNNTIRQLKRYAAEDKINMIILVVERNLTIPEEINGVKCLSFGVNRNWGIAL